MNSSKNKLNNEIIYNFHYFLNAQFDKNYFYQLILLFNLCLLLFKGFIVLFNIIHEPHYTISANLIIAKKF